jgi:hypothetical protein
MLSTTGYLVVIMTGRECYYLVVVLTGPVGSCYQVIEKVPVGPVGPVGS